jgi:hypothetical protein
MYVAAIVTGFPGSATTAPHGSCEANASRLALCALLDGNICVHRYPVLRYAEWLMPVVVYVPVRELLHIVFARTWCGSDKSPKIDVVSRVEKLPFESARPVHVLLGCVVSTTYTTFPKQT